MQTNFNNKQYSVGNKADIKCKKHVQRKLTGSLIVLLISIVISIKLLTNINYKALNSHEVTVTTSYINQPKKVINNQQQTNENKFVSNISTPKTTVIDKTILPETNIVKNISKNNEHNINSNIYINDQKIKDQNNLNSVYNNFNITPSIEKEHNKVNNPYEILNDKKPIDNYYINLASSSNINKIINIQNYLANNNIKSTIITINQLHKTIYKLISGPFDSKKLALINLNHIKKSIEN